MWQGCHNNAVAVLSSRDAGLLLIWSSHLATVTLPFCPSTQISVVPSLNQTFVKTAADGARRPVCEGDDTGVSDCAVHMQMKSL